MSALVTNPTIDIPRNTRAKQEEIIANTMKVITEHFDGLNPDQIPNAPHNTNGIAHQIDVPTYATP